MKKSQILLAPVIMIMFLSACVGRVDSYHTSNPKPQTWKGHISGMVAGDIKIDTWEMEDSEGHQKTENKMIVKNFRSIDGHSGRIQGVLSGLITDGSYEGSFLGNAVAIEGNASIRGIFFGHFSGDRGKGTYQIRTDRAGTIYTGKWILKGQQH